MRREALGEPRVAAVHDQRVLREIVRPDAEEVADLGEPVGHDRRRRRLDHHAQGHRLRRLHPPLAQPRRFRGDQVAGLLDLVEPRDERNHQLDVGVGRRAQDGADLGPEHLGLVETDADGAPAEERVRLGRTAERRRELVPAQVEGAHHDGMAGERFAHPPEVGRLLVLRGEGAVLRDEELRPQQADAFGAVRLRGRDLVGEVHVAAQRHTHAVHRHRRLGDGLLEMRRQLPPPRLAPLRLRGFLGGRIEEDGAARAVQDHHGARRDARHRAPQTEDRRDPDRVRQDRRMRGARALLADQADHVLAVELDREPRRQLLGDDDRGLGDPVPDVVGAAVHQVLDHPDRHAGDVGETLPEHRTPGVGPGISHLQRFELERLLGSEVVLTDQLGRAPDELPVLEHEDLRVEDARLVHAGAVHRPGAQLAQMALHVLDRRAQPTDLFLHLGARHDPVRHLRQRPTHHHRRPRRDTGRHADALQQALGHSASSASVSAFKCIS